jgi:hypothetical protein
VRRRWQLLAASTVLGVACTGGGGSGDVGAFCEGYAVYEDATAAAEADAHLADEVRDDPALVDRILQDVRLQHTAAVAGLSEVAVAEIRDAAERLTAAFSGEDPTPAQILASREAAREIEAFAARNC